MPKRKDSQVQKARAKRDIQRKAADAIIEEVNNMLQNIDEANKNEIKVKLKTLIRHHTSLQLLNDEISEHCEEDELTAELEAAFAFDQKIEQVIDTLEVQLDNLTFEAESVNADAIPSVQPVSPTHSSIKHDMPKLELTKFSGDPLRFEEFWDDFQCSIDSRTDMTTIDKFKILRQSLTGEAASVASGYYLTEANYNELKETLKERFGDKQVAIFAHLEALLELKPVSHELSQLTKIRDQCEAHIRSLAGLGLSEDMFGQVFAPILLSKLPKFVKIDMHRRNGGKPWTLSELRETLRQEIQIRAKSESYNVGDVDKGRDKSQVPKEFRKQKSDWIPRHPSKPFQGTTSALFVQGGKNRQNSQSDQDFKKPKTCVFCQGKHASFHCTTFPTAEARKNRLTEIQRCIVCLQPGHAKNDCYNKERPCGLCGKPGHNNSLCFSKFGSKHQSGDSGHSHIVQRKPELNPEAPVFYPDNVHSVSSRNVSSKRRGTAILESAIFPVVGEKGTYMARAVFDQGSTLSFATTRLARKIGAKYTGIDVASIGRFGDETRQQSQYATYQFEVVLKDGRHKLIDVDAVDNVSTPLKLMPIDLTQISEFCTSADLAETLVDEPTDVEIDILIGLDYYYQFMKSSEWRCPNGLVLKESTVGHILTGYISNTPGLVSDHQLLIMRSPRRSSPVDLEAFWDIENLGISDKFDENDDDTALKMFNDSVKIENGRYQVQWPFKTKVPDLPTNYNVALRRLKSVYRKLSENYTLMQDYDKIFQNQLSLGIIEKAPLIPEGIIHYLPHHCVLKPQSATTKVRVVFDASSKPNDQYVSLNESMYRGPTFTNDLCGLLFRFRQSPIAVLSDVEKAFLQISLQNEYRDCTRFLWLKDITKPPSPENLTELRYARVLFGATASPFLLAATINHHMKSVGSTTATQITENIYVDNVVSGHSDIASAQQYYHEAKQLFQQISMNLREWYSNDPAFMNVLPAEDKGKSIQPSVLGLKWDISSDHLYCSVGKTGIGTPTKRSILQFIASVYDPCGWFSPIVIRGKIMMQTLWKEKYNWDERVSPELMKEFTELVPDIIAIQFRPVERKLFHEFANKGSSISFQLHCFVDASAKAYSAAIYLRAESSNEVQSKLLFAKSRVAPIKALTIPRLELLAFLIGSKLLKFVDGELKLPIIQAFVWSDSSCALNWVTNEKVTTTFVKNRVRQIKAVPNLEYRYVPTAENPADLPSRGVKMSVLRDCKMWWHGPEWLQADPSEWPQNKVDPRAAETAPKKNEDHCQLVSSKPLEPTPMPDELFDLNRFSSLLKLHRVTCYVFRAILAMRKRKIVGRLSVNELIDAKQFWIKRIQQQHFHGILQESTSPKWLALKHQLGLFVDPKGIIRCKGRFGNAQNLRDETKYPKLLPHQSQYTRLVVERCHAIVLHSGLKMSLAEVRQEYWIPRGRMVVKSVLNDCRVCRRHVGGPFRAPDEPPLPDFRSSIRRPFSCIGLDYLGPLYIRTSTGGHEKVWVAIFTCAVIRAIHLEVVVNMSAEEFLLCFRRFIALCGRPQLVVSDNAKQFRLTDKVLRRLWREAIESDLVQEFSTSEGIQWKFITELAPWMGGFYERLVAPVKDALKKSLGSRTIRLNELQTIIYEITAILNSRPLLYAEEEVGEQMLTPSHLLFRSQHLFPEIPDVEEYGDRLTKCDQLIQHWKAGQRVLRNFWDVWLNQYLLSLREFAHSQKQRGVSNFQPEPGMVVLVKDRQPRGTWKMARIVRLIASKDNHTRSAEVRLPNGTILRRAVKMLYPLEGNLQTEPGNDFNSTANTTEDGTPPEKTARPQRTAAIESRARTRQQLAA